jgi:hypothetical protein
MNNWIMFLILQRFIETINDLNKLYRPITSKRFLIPDDLSGDPQNDDLGDNLLLLL